MAAGSMGWFIFYRKLSRIMQDDARTAAFKAAATRGPLAVTVAHLSDFDEVIDVRSPDEYTGKKLHMPDYPQEGTLRGGHIPTAIRMNIEL